MHIVNFCDICSLYIRNAKRTSILQSSAMKTNYNYYMYRRRMFPTVCTCTMYSNLIHQNTQKDTINFVCYYYARDVFSVISKFFIPFGKIFVRHFPCDVKYLSMQQHLLILVTTTTSVSNYSWPRSHIQVLTCIFTLCNYRVPHEQRFQNTCVAAKCHSLRSESLQICFKQWVKRSLNNRISDCRVASQTLYYHITSTSSKF